MVIRLQYGQKSMRTFSRNPSNVVGVIYCILLFWNFSLGFDGKSAGFPGQSELDSESCRESSTTLQPQEFLPFNYKTLMYFKAQTRKRNSWSLKFQNSLSEFAVLSQDTAKIEDSHSNTIFSMDEKNLLKPSKPKIIGILIHDDPVKQFTLKKRTKIAITSFGILTIASAVLAHNYMTKADASYDEYLQAGHPDEMDRLFRRTEEFDRKAGYSLIGFETFFLMTIFSFIISLPL